MASSIEKAVKAGTEGISKRMEALKLNFKTVGVKLEVNVHVQGDAWKGWTEITGEDTLVGTTGQGKRMEAIKLCVTGETEGTIWYRVHVQTHGWMDWVRATDSKDLTVKDTTVGTGDYAGTVGKSKRIEAIQIVVLNDTESSYIDAKQKAIKELENHLNPAEYSKNIDEVNKVIAKNKKAIEGITLQQCASNVDAIKTALATAIDELDEIASDAKLLKDVKDKIDFYVNEDNGLIETAFEKTLKEANVRNIKNNGTFLDNRSIKSAVESAKTLIRTATTVEQAETLYATAADNILNTVKAYIADYIENVCENGLTENNVKYLLLEERCEKLVEKLDTIIASAKDRAPRLNELIAVLNTGSIASEYSEVTTLNGALRTFEEVKVAAQGRLDAYTSIKVTNIPNKILEVVMELPESYQKATGIGILDLGNANYTCETAKTRLTALKAENVKTYADVMGIAEQTETSIKLELTTFINNLLNKVITKVESDDNYMSEETTELKALRAEMSNSKSTVASLVTKLNAVTAKLTDPEE